MTVPSPRGLYPLVQNWACVWLPPPNPKAARAWDLLIAMRSFPLFQPVFLPSGAGEAGFHTGNTQRREPATRTDNHHHGAQWQWLWRWTKIWMHRAREGARTWADKSPLRMKPSWISEGTGEGPDGDEAECNRRPGIFCAYDVSSSALHALDGLLNSRLQSTLEIGTKIPTLQIKQKRHWEFRQFAGNHKLIKARAGISTHAMDNTPSPQEPYC